MQPCYVAAANELIFVSVNNIKRQALLRLHMCYTWKLLLIEYLIYSNRYSRHFVYIQEIQQLSLDRIYKSIHKVAHIRMWKLSTLFKMKILHVGWSEHSSFPIFRWMKWIKFKNKKYINKYKYNENTIIINFQL